MLCLFNRYPHVHALCDRQHSFGSFQTTKDREKVKRVIRSVLFVYFYSHCDMLTHHTKHLTLAELTDSPLPFVSDGKVNSDIFILASMVGSMNSFNVSAQISTTQHETGNGRINHSKHQANNSAIPLKNTPRSSML